MRMYQYDKHFDFHALGREIKRKREEKGWTQEYLAQLVNRTPRSIMYIENRGQYPSFDTFYQLVTLLEISVDQFFFPDKLNGESTCRKQIDVMLNSMNEKELTVKYKYGRRVFWAKGYYVNTVGGNEAKIRKYIQEQEMQDQMSDQLSFREYEDPFKNIADLDDDSPEIPTDSRRKK